MQLCLFIYTNKTFTHCYSVGSVLIWVLLFRISWYGVEARDVCRIGGYSLFACHSIVCDSFGRAFSFFFYFSFIGEKAAITWDKYINISSRTTKRIGYFFFVLCFFFFVFLVCIARVMLAQKHIRPSSNSRACKITSQIVHVFPKRYANRHAKRNEKWCSISISMQHTSLYCPMANRCILINANN